MRQVKIFDLTARLVLFVPLITAGCADRTRQAPQSKVGSQEESSTPTLALKFVAGDSTTYRVTRQNDKSVEWQGPDESKPKQFTGGHTGSRIEMTFTQQIQSTDDKGNATAKITIKELKYLTMVKNQIILDFDSSRQEDQSSPLGKLIGQSYTIELTASGQVPKVIDAADARAAVLGDSQADKTATNLLSDDTIKEMHTVSALPPADKDQVSPGQSWSNIENFSFDLMGAKSYEKIYTLKEIRDSFGAMFWRILGKNRGDHRMATASMQAVPSTANVKELYKEQVISPFSQMYDSTEKFTGELKLDLTDGKVEQWREELVIEWIVADFNAKPEEQPDALKMTAKRLYNIERMN